MFIQKKFFFTIVILVVFSNNIIFANTLFLKTFPFEMAASDPSHFSAFEHVKIFSSHFADFEYVKFLVVILLTLNKSKN